MPICEGKNKSTLNSVLDTDRHGDVAKLKKSREQAYFNSYDFDAIEELPSEEEDAIELDKRQSSVSHRRNVANEATRNHNIGAISNVYLKRLTSYFTTSNRIPEPMKIRSAIDTECEVQSRSDNSSRSSTNSPKANSIFDTNNTIDDSNPGTQPNGINNFLLPRAILKSQSAITANSMSTNSLSSIGSNKVNSIGSIKSLIINNVNINSNSINNNSSNKNNNTNNNVDVHKNNINGGRIGGTNNPRKVAGVLGTNNSGFSMRCYDKSDRERVILPSHYSTEKSGSSGYYSSNLCSTSSVEDHIYSEPVIDVIQSRVLPLTKSLPPALVRKLRDETRGSRTSQSCNVTNSMKIVDNDDKVKAELRTLETSIENLDRHLKSYPKFVGHQRPTMTYLPCDDENCMAQTMVGGFKRQPLPTIMEGIDSQTPPKTQNTWSDDMDDSLMDIDLDSFLLVNEINKVSDKTEPLNGIDNPNYRKGEVLNDEALENNYKCSKYVNSCPEDAYNVESVIEGVDTDVPDKSLVYYLKKYEDQIHFQSTKDMLEEIREKLRSLIISTNTNSTDRILPNELEKNIATLKLELETYLRIMNHNSEMEIKQLCAGLVNNQKLVAMTKAFERRKSFDKQSDNEYEFTYEPVQCCDGSIKYEISNLDPGSIRCSDPNFKMKRKSLNEVFPNPIDNLETIIVSNNSSSDDNISDNDKISGPSAGQKKISPSMKSVASGTNSMHLQRNLSFQRPTLGSVKELKVPGKNNDEKDDKNAILEWHKNKPSIWELYYGTNRINQTLVGKRGQLIKNPGSVLSYPSSRPESDFTLDLPRAEQLRLKMEKEKKFRQRCRILTTFLSLVFFLLTVMIVSLVLTRGKRMFGSML